MGFGGSHGLSHLSVQYIFMWTFPLLEYWTFVWEILWIPLTKGQYLDS